MTEKMSFKTLCGKNVLPFVKEVSELRIKIFREFPYLYDGNMDYEREYFEGFSKDPRSMLILGYVGGKLGVASTALPLVSSADILKEAVDAFSRAGLRPEKYYYYGEIIVLPEFRKSGIASSVYKMHETQAKAWGFSDVCLATVVRDKSDPRQPKGYSSSDHVWKSFGFKKQEIFINYKWPTLMENGSAKDLMNPMVFWTKPVS